MNWFSRQENLAGSIGFNGERHDVPDPGNPLP